MNKCKKCDLLSEERRCFVCGRWMPKHTGASLGGNPYNWKPGQMTVGEILEQASDTRRSS